MVISYWPLAVSFSSPKTKGQRPKAKSMLYTITAVSPEVEDFAIELQIESDATFADLHALIHETCGWERFKPSAFYLCDHRWHRDRIIPEDSFEDDTMDELELGDFLEDEGQRMQYIFDPDKNRGLLMEVSQISYGRHIDGPACRRRHGTAPALIPLPERPISAPNGRATVPAGLVTVPEGSVTVPEGSLTVPEGSPEGLPLFLDDDLEPTDDDLFDIEEIDLEGFDINEA